MRITINTIIDDKNYGNRLQNYALQTVLEAMGHEVTTIDRRILLTQNTKKKKLVNYLRTGEFIAKLRIFFLNTLRKIWTKFSGRKKRMNHKYRATLDIHNNVNFSDFTSTYIHMIPRHVVDIWQWVNNNSDLLVIGSDQVWNYKFWSGATIEFALPVKVRKVSYAASIGVDSIPADLKNVYRHGLSSLASITVREKSGQQIVKTLTGLDADVVLDPTLLLDDQDWSKIMHRVDLKNNRYLLTYFLNYPTDKNNNSIQRFADQHDLDVINIFDNGTTIYSPGQLLYLFKHASFVYTDSFHASVFSIIFNKGFKTLPRNHPVAMGSRLETLFKTFGITDGGITLDQLSSYTELNVELQKMRNRSKSILERIVMN